MKYAIGLDNGGTMTKAAIFDENGKELAVSSMPTKMITPKPDYTERSMDELWEANCKCIKGVLEKSGISSEEIIGLAVCGHGKGLYLWGKDNKPAYNGIISTDRRAWEYPEKWKETGISQKAYEHIYQKILPGQPLSLLAWLKDNEPEVYNNIKYVFSVKDFVRYKLTGEAYSEATDISGSGLLSLKSNDKSKELLKLFGLDEIYEAIPRLKYSYDNCGFITKEVAEKTGLKEGTPVAGGMFDIDSCAIAMAVNSPEELCTISGTWSINEYISKSPVLHTNIAMNSLFAVPGYYLIEESSPTSAGNLEWIIKNCIPEVELKSGEKIYGAINRLVEEINPNDSDVYFVPFLYGSNRSPIARSSFVGITNYNDYRHLLSAVFEGVVFSHKTHIDKLLSNRKPPKTIRLAGGAANSDVWVQMFADVLGFPIETVKGVSELGALGCAMAVFVSTGVYKDYKEAASQMVKVDAPIKPQIKFSEIYERKYNNYTKICDALDPIWKTLQH